MNKMVLKYKVVNDMLVKKNLKLNIRRNVVVRYKTRYICVVTQRGKRYFCEV